MTYSVTGTKTGIRISFNDEPVGGWNIAHQQPFVLGTYAEAALGRIGILRLKGFNPVPRPSGQSCCWKLPESDLASFHEAIRAMTGEAIRFVD